MQRELKRFAAALIDALLAQDVDQGTVGAALNVTQSTVSRWCRGDREPSMEQVAELELVLNQPAGSLSRHLGYVPVEVMDRRHVAPLEERVANDPDLPEDAKTAILAIIERFRSPTSGTALMLQRRRPQDP